MEAGGGAVEGRKVREGEEEGTSTWAGVIEEAVLNSRETLNRSNCYPSSGGQGRWTRASNRTLGSRHCDTSYCVVRYSLLSM